eukprot:1729500-Pyramimonas_sp.AAC.1
MADYGPNVAEDVPRWASRVPYTAEDRLGEGGTGEGEEWGGEGGEKGRRSEGDRKKVTGRREGREERRGGKTKHGNAARSALPRLGKESTPPRHCTTARVYVGQGGGTALPVLTALARGVQVVVVGAVVMAMPMVNFQLGNELTTCMRICLQRDAATNSMPPRQRQARQKRPGKIQGEELEMTVDCYHPVSLPSRPSAHLALA